MEIELEEVKKEYRIIIQVKKGKEIEHKIVIVNIFGLIISNVIVIGSVTEQEESEIKEWIYKNKEVWR